MSVVNSRATRRPEIEVGGCEKPDGIAKHVNLRKEADVARVRPKHVRDVASTLRADTEQPRPDRGACIAGCSATNALGECRRRVCAQKVDILLERILFRIAAVSTFHCLARISRKRGFDPSTLSACLPYVRSSLLHMNRTGC